jgi:hypothetical protein
VADFGGAGADPYSRACSPTRCARISARRRRSRRCRPPPSRGPRARFAGRRAGALDADRAVALAAAAAPPAAAVVDGAVRGVEGARVVSLRVLEPATGRVLAAHRATANTLVEVMPTVDRLAGQLLRDIERRADAPPAAGPPAARPCAS